MPRIARIVVVYFDAGGGHRAPAQVLSESLQGEDAEVELLRLEDVIEPIDPLHRLAGIHGGEFYNWTLRRGWTFGTRLTIPLFHIWVRLFHTQQVRLLRERWRELPPDVVVSVIPHFNRALYESLHVDLPEARFVTLLTDLADYPPHYWFKNQDQDFICASDVAEQQARKLAPDARVWRTSGMLIDRRFHEPSLQNRAAQRRDLGLDPERPTGLVLFGAYGSERMIEVARQASQDSRVQLIMLCGRNESLATRLKKLRLPGTSIQGVTHDVPQYMALSDFFIGKPGSGSLAEALAMRLPVIVESNFRTLAQERYNVQWIREQGVGIVLPDFRSLPQAIGQLLDPETRGPMLRRIEALENRACFEVPKILMQILEARSRATHSCTHSS